MAEENKEYWWSLIIDLEEKKQKLESRLSSTTDPEFEEYCLIWEMLGVLWKTVPSL